MPSPIVVLTGAGISRESGLHTFRDPDGIWARVSIEEVATPEAFARDPGRVHRFYNDRRRQLLDEDVQPNAAHRALVRLEQAHAGEVLVVTQNIDDLHERAGQRNLIHMHGEILKLRCGACERVRVWHEAAGTDTACPACGAVGRMRPHVVWFGEMPFEMERIQDALARCGTFLSIGTSGTVYPAAGFVQLAKMMADARAIEANLEPTEGADQFDEQIPGPASETVPALVERLIQGTNP
jgi:NAD-dependent deacetylase